MKQKITLVSLMLLIAVFTLGQNASEKKHRLSPDKRTEMNEKLSCPVNHHTKDRFLPVNKRVNTQSTMHKSTRAIKHRLDSLILKTWDDSTTQWFDDQKHELLYSGNHNLIQQVRYAWDGSTSQWVTNMKYELTNDGNCYFTQEIRYLWDDSTSQWDNYSKNEYTYDGNCNWTKFVHYAWDDSTSQWDNYWKIENTYDGNSNRTQQLEYHWDESTSQWLFFKKHEYTYDGNNNMEQQFWYYWDEITSQWVVSRKYEYTYDGSGNLADKLRYNRDESTSQWVVFSKWEYTYDVNGNQQEFWYFQEIRYSWDESTSQWDNYSKSEFSYDTTYSINDLIFPSYPSYGDEVSFKFKLIDKLRYMWDDSNNNWVNHRKIIYHYSEQEVGNISNIAREKISLYPNPVFECLNFSFTGKNNSAVFELYDIQGRKLLTKKINNNEQINLDFLNRGLYLYNIYIDGNNNSGKLIKE